jgi:hypothetical protein
VEEDGWMDGWMCEASWQESEGGLKSEEVEFVLIQSMKRIHTSSSLRIGETSVTQRARNERRGK